MNRYTTAGVTESIQLPDCRPSGSYAGPEVLFWEIASGVMVRRFLPDGKLTATEESGIKLTPNPRCGTRRGKIEGLILLRA